MDIGEAGWPSKLYCDYVTVLRLARRPTMHGNNYMCRVGIGYNIGHCGEQ